MKTIGIFLIIGWIFRIIVMLVVVFIGFGALAFFVNKDTAPPHIEKAQYAIQTYSSDNMKIPSRIYFTNDIVYNGSTPMVEEYWKFDGEKYKLVKEPREFTELFTVVRRTR